MVIYMAELYPWYGYKKIAVLCRWAGHKVKNRHAYRVMDAYGLLHRRRCSAAELYQATKLYELLPKGPNELWQMDVTYLHIPSYGCWSAKTGRSYIGTRPSNKKVIELCQTVSEKTSRNWEFRSVDELVTELNRLLVDWANYFCLGPVSKAYAAWIATSAAGSVSG